MSESPTRTKLTTLTTPLHPHRVDTQTIRTTYCFDHMGWWMISGPNLSKRSIWNASLALETLLRCYHINSFGKKTFSSMLADSHVSPQTPAHLIAISPRKKPFRGARRNNKLRRRWWLLQMLLLGWGAQTMEPFYHDWRLLRSSRGGRIGHLKKSQNSTSYHEVIRNILPKHPNTCWEGICTPKIYSKTPHLRRYLAV